MLGFGCIAMLALDLLIPPLRGFFHGQSLIFMLLYLWSKMSPETPVSLFGLIKFKAMYLPFMLMALDVVQGGGIITDIVGILAGHLYFFLTEVYPLRSRRQIITTPQWM